MQCAYWICLSWPGCHFDVMSTSLAILPLCTLILSVAFKNSSFIFYGWSAHFDPLHYCHPTSSVYGSGYILDRYYCQCCALTLLVGQEESHLTKKLSMILNWNWIDILVVVIWLELCMSWSSSLGHCDLRHLHWNPDWFDILLPSYTGRRGILAITRGVCVMIRSSGQQKLVVCQRL